ncbi:SubName: Full=Uncharacterized protein {ECO:0000313/EMBL:CCA72477.1} [Serendipita indica DSM 11827]|nr:SubName: Full=Uncharacterized protein {ECO:0000313/EMBL:CCA72477.1} [Serendipita indica DSM 11827]
MSQSIRTHQTPERSIERETPRNPPGLPLPADRLWQPHEDGYWRKLREEWGSTLDLNKVEDDQERIDGEDMDEVDLATANGTVFRIVLADDGRNAHSHDIHRVGATPDMDSRGLNIASPGDVPHPARPISRPLPLLTHTKTSKKSRKFQPPTLSVSVTTTTRTYSGDVFPPPYTPRPTGTERSFGVDGKLKDDEMEPRARWPVAKWLFLLGFLFPLLWLFGSFLLFSGLRKMADSSPSSIESQVSDRKLDTQSRDTTTSSITHLIAQEVVWSKRCAWAISLFAVCSFTALGILKAVGM